MDPLDLLTDADLSALAAALRSGRLNPPITAVSVHRYFSGAVVEAVATRLQQLDEDGLQPRHMALLAETIVKTRSLGPRHADLVDLVWTGPETLGTTNRDTGVVVRDLFGEAESEVLVAGFAVYQGRSVFKRLAERMVERPGLHVRLFLDVQRHHTDTSLDSEQLYRFMHRFRTQDWPGEKLPELFYDPRSLDLEAVRGVLSLHAKCIVVDRRLAFVTSANFTEAAQTRNIEVGALVKTAGFAAQLADHFDALTVAGLLRGVLMPGG